MRVEIDRLRTEPPSDMTRDLIKAARDLSLPDYQQYKKHAQLADKYVQITSSTDGGTDAVTTVKSIEHPDAPPRVFANADDRCICENCLANEGMCQHEILAKGGYDQKWFLPKHMRRKHVSGSLNGWMPPDDAPLITEELIEEDNDAFSADFNVVDKGNVDEIEDDGKQTSVPHIPPNPFESMKPLGLSRLKTSLSDVMNCYAKLGTDAQYEVSKSVLEIEEVMKKHRHARKH